MSIAYGSSIIINADELKPRSQNVWSAARRGSAADSRFRADYFYGNDREGYEIRVLKELRRLCSSKVGAAVLHEIDDCCAKKFGNSAVVKIVPLLAKDQDSVNPSNYLAAAPEGSAVPETCGFIRPGRSNDIAGVGTGAGATSTIFYDPMDCDRRPGNWTDEVLLHELVHAMRNANAFFLCNRPSGIGAYDNEEEFFAILIANIYRAGELRTPPRANHSVDFRSLLSPQEFYRNQGLVEGLIHKLWAQQRNLVQQLANLDYYFNPIRQILGPNANFGACRENYAPRELEWPTIWQMTLRRRFI